jgi:pyridoxal phosphate enzyme (YggS family)
MGIRENVESLTASIAEAALRAGRSPQDITLCAVSKFHPLAAVEEAYAAGVRVFGESRVQELYPKLRGWEALRKDARAHMIGRLQRNKAKKALEVCACVQSVDRIELIDELGALTKTADTPLAVLFEINSGEEAKSGFRDEAAFFQGVEKALGHKGLRVEGLMTIAPLAGGEEAARAAFRKAYRLREEARTRYPQARWDTLSMGMSGDYRIAIEEGSTMVRIGTAVFGERRH